MWMLLLPGLELVSWIRESDDRLTVETGCNRKQAKTYCVYFYFVLHCMIELVLCMGVCERILLPLPGFGIAVAAEAVQKFP